MMYGIMTMMLQSHQEATSHCRWVQSHLLPSGVGKCDVHAHRPCGGCGPSVERCLGVRMCSPDLEKVHAVFAVEPLVNHHRE